MLISTYIRLIRHTTIASLMVLTAACSTRQTPIAVTPIPIALMPPEPQPSATAKPAIALKVDPFMSAEDKAIGAAKLAQNASTIEDWELVKSKLQQAIALMKTVPASSPKRAIAQKNLATYQQQLKVAQQQRQTLAGSTPTKSSSPQKSESAEKVAVASIPALSGGGSLNSENYSRVEFGMSPSEVRSLLGAPTREEGNSPNFSWTWQSSDKKTNISIGFYENKVAGKTCVSSSSTMQCVTKT